MDWVIFVKNNGQRCIISGKLIEGRDVILASELMNFLEKQGSQIIVLDKGEEKVLKRVRLEDKYENTSPA